MVEESRGFLPAVHSIGICLRPQGVKHIVQRFAGLMQRRGRRNMGQRLHVSEGSARIEYSRRIVPILRAGFCNLQHSIAFFLSFTHLVRTLLHRSRKIWRKLVETPRHNWLNICPSREMFSNACGLEGDFDFLLSSLEVYNTSTKTFAHGLCVGPAVCDIFINSLVSDL